MTKPILFIDFDGTICMERYWRSLPAAEHQYVQELLFGKDMSKVHDWMRGEYTAEEINSYISEETGVDNDYLWNIFVEDCVSMKVLPTTLEMVQSLRNNYVLVLITGNMDSFSRFTLPALELEKYFDDISVSYYEKKHKLDDGGSLFLKYTEKYGVNVRDCILLDDSSKVCDLFTQIGGKALKVSEEQTAEDYLKSLIKVRTSSHRVS